MKKALLLIPVLVVLLLPAVAQAAPSASPLAAWQTDGTVFASARIGGTLYIGGDFDNAVDPTTGALFPRHSLMAVDAATGALLQSWAPDVECLPDNHTPTISCSNPYVRTMVTDGTNIYVGGSFTAICPAPDCQTDGITSANQFMWGIITQAGTLVPTSGRTNNTVHILTLDGTTLYAGGNFTKFNGDSSGDRLAAASLPSATPVAGFTPNVDGLVRGVTVLPNGDLVITGQFNSVNGESAATTSKIAELHGATDPVQGTIPWKDRPIYNTYNSVYYGGYVYVGRGEGKGGQLLQYDPDGGYGFPNKPDCKLNGGPACWARSANGDVQTVGTFTSNGQTEIIAGGHWGTWTGLKGYARLIAVDPVSGLFDPTWQPNPDSSKGVWYVGDQGDRLVVGGEFTHISGETHQHLAIFCATNPCS